MIELGGLRVKLDQRTERVVSGLKDRSRFRLNAPVYQPDGVAITGRSGVSLLKFALEGLEQYHASLGRFIYPEQHSVFGRDYAPSPVERFVDRLSLPILDLDFTDQMLDFYGNLLPKFCAEGSDPNTYGGTVYTDACLLQLIHERINIGRYVAESKKTTDPSIVEVKNDIPVLRSRLKDIGREEKLVARARKIADAYEFNPDITEEVFRWMIDRTLDLEIEYIQKVED